MTKMTLTLSESEAETVKVALLALRGTAGRDAQPIDAVLGMIEQAPEELLIGVFVDGGVVQDVTIPTAFSGRVIVMDFDTEGADEDRLVRVPLLDGAGRMTGERSGAAVGVYDGSAVKGSPEQLLDVLAQTDAGLGADMALYGRGAAHDAGVERCLEQRGVLVGMS